MHNITKQDISKWERHLDLALASLDDRKPVLLVDAWGDTIYDGYAPRRPFTPAKVA